MKVANSFALRLAVLLALVLVFAGTILWNVLRQNLFDDLETARRTSQQRLKWAASVLTNTLQAGQYQNLQTHLDELGETSPIIAKIEVVAANGTVLASYQRDRPAADGYSLESPIAYAYDRRATLRLQVDLDTVNDRHHKFAMRIGVIFAVLSMLVVLLVVLAIERQREARQRRLSEERYRNLVDTMSEGLGVHDGKGIVTYVNARACEMLGYAYGELVGRPMAAFVAEESRAMLSHQLEPVRKGVRQDLEITWIRKDGRRVETLVAPSPRFDRKGELIENIAVLTDITGRRVTEDNLQRFRNAIDSSADAIVLVDRASMRYVDVNETLSELTGYSREELLQMTPMDLFSASREVLERDYDVIIAGGDSSANKVEGHYRRKDGTLIPIETQRRAFRTDAGWIIVGSARDIRRRRKAEQTIAESEARFRAVFERSTAGIAIWGLNGQFLSVNEAFCDFVGYPAADLVGHLSAGDLRPAGEDEGLALTGRMLRGEIAHVTRDRPYRRADGSTVWGRATVAAVPGPGSVPQYFVSVVIDITEAREARQRVERLNAELEARVAERTGELRSVVEKLEVANLDLDSFNHSIAHDLRQPVSAIWGFSDLLAAAIENSSLDDAREFAREIDANAGRMDQMIEALLRFSSIGRGTLRVESVDMRALVGSVLQGLTQGAYRQVEVSIEEVPPADGDAALLRHVWTNLIGNALKYSGKNPAPRVEIRGERRDGQVAYTVSDNGVGFDMADAGRIFGVFERLPTSAGFDGTGVGLAIAQRIVRRHGGLITAESSPGKGATFRFTLPA